MTLLLEMRQFFVYEIVFVGLGYTVVLLMVMLPYVRFISKISDRRECFVLDMKEGLNKKEFFIVYQPIVNGYSRNIESLEALIRWKHPTLGIISPDEFIPLAEERGIINDLTDYVLELTLEELQQSNTLSILSLGVNIPPSYLGSVERVKKLKYYTEQFRKIGIGLIAEITERQVLEPEGVAYLDLLRDYGLKFAIDDFGTGHTSLSMIQNIKFDYLKIDKCFIDKVGLKTTNPAVLDMIIELGDRLGVITVAEGVETKEQADYLIRSGVNKLQGYYFSKPLPLDEIEMNSSSNFYSQSPSKTSRLGLKPPAINSFLTSDLIDR
ncbi:EAL domain-containing protein [Vibrio sp. SA48]